MVRWIVVSFLALATAGAAQAQQIGDVFYIAIENHNFTQPSGTPNVPEQLLGNPAAPYLNSLVTPGNPKSTNVSYASNYQNVSPTLHPSEPNYVFQVSGANGPLNDKDPYPNNIVNAPNLGQLLQQKYGAGGWKTYQEDIELSSNPVPLTSFSGASAAYTNAYNGSHQYNYAAKHNPFVFFPTTNGNAEASHYAPLQQLQTDLANNTVGKFNWITPDQYNDMHLSLNTDFTYAGQTWAANTDQQAIALGDNFLSRIVPEIEASQAFKNNGVIVIWTDETEGDEAAGSTAAYASTEIIISPLAKGNAYDSTLHYSHSPDLATWQNVFGVSAHGGGYLGAVAGANTLSDLFTPGVIPDSRAERLSHDGDRLRRRRGRRRRAPRPGAAGSRTPA